MWQLWSHNQHQIDWGSISASTWIALQGAYHHSERSTIASSPTLEAYCLELCTAIASAAFGRLRGSIWDRSGIRLDTMQKVYRSVVLPTLLYTCETLTVYQRHARRLNHLHTSCLRKLLQTQVTRQDPRHRCPEKGSVYTLLKLAQLPKCLLNVCQKILYGELQIGKRSHACQKKRYKDTLKVFLKDFNIPTESWEQIAQDRTKCKAS